MSVTGFDQGTAVCVNHPRRETAVRCSKCGDPICTACMVQTPVGMRCRRCANLKRLPQFDVGLGLLARAVPAGLLTSVAVWFVISFVPFLRFFLAILVGVAVGEVMSRLARRRTSRVLEVAAVVDVVAGLLIVSALPVFGGLDLLLSSALIQPRAAVVLLLPAVIASFVAVLKLR